MSSRIYLALIIVLALLLRIVFLSQSVDNPFAHNLIIDEGYYHALGQSVASVALGLLPEFQYLDPLYGYLIGGVYALFPANPFLIKLLQIFLDVINIVLLYRIGRQLWNPGSGLIAALLYALYEVAFFYTTTLLKTITVTTAILLWLWFSLRLRQRSSLLSWFAFGLFLGACTLLRSYLLLLAPCTLLILLWQHRYRSAAPLLCCVLGVLVLLSAGAARSYLISGQWQWLPSNSAMALAAAYNEENPTGAYQVPGFVKFNHPVEMHFYFHQEAERRSGQTLNKEQMQAYWRTAALQYIKANPDAVLISWWHKLRRLVANQEVPNNRSIALESRFTPILALPLPQFAVALALGLPGLILGLRKNKQSIILWFPILLITAISMAFYVLGRIRFPLAPVLLLGAGFCCYQMYTWLKQRYYWPVLITGFVIVILAYLSMSITLPQESPLRTELRIADAYANTGQLQQAYNIASKLHQDHPGNAAILELLGKITLDNDNSEQAIYYNQLALQYDPQRHVAAFNLSIGLQKTNRYEEAVAAMHKALQSRYSPEYLFHLGQLYQQLGDSAAANKYFQQVLDEAAPASSWYQQAKTRLNSP